MAMTDLQQYAQSVFVGLIVSFLLAKLFSVLFTFRDENIRSPRANSSPNPNENQPDVVSKEYTRSEAEFSKKHVSGSKKEPSIDQRKKAAAVSSDSDDDWEGVECTELDDAFSAATAFVAATAADRSSLKVSSDVQLQLYGLYKIATEGPCSVPQPSPIKMTARAKWNAWHKLGSMPQEEAMQKYLEIITELYPTWADGSTSKKRVGESNESMGPVFCSFVHDEESGNELKLDAIHDFAREGDMENLVKCVEGGTKGTGIKDDGGNYPCDLSDSKDLTFV